MYYIVEQSVAKCVSNTCSIKMYTFFLSPLGSRVWDCWKPVRYSDIPTTRIFFIAYHKYQKLCLKPWPKLLLQNPFSGSESSNIYLRELSKLSVENGLIKTMELTRKLIYVGNTFSQLSMISLLQMIILSKKVVWF